MTYKGDAAGGGWGPVCPCRVAINRCPVRLYAFGPLALTGPPVPETRFYW